jgi:hypothetical protein
MHQELFAKTPVGRGRPLVVDSALQFDSLDGFDSDKDAELLMNGRAIHSRYPTDVLVSQWLLGSHKHLGHRQPVLSVEEELR